MSNPLDEEVYGGRESSDSETIKQGNAGVAQSEYERAGEIAPDAEQATRDDGSLGMTGNGTDRDIGEGAD